MIAQTQISSNTNSSYTTTNSINQITRETIEKASALKLGKTKHQLIMLMGRLWEQYGNIHVGLSKLSFMLEERIDKQLKKRQMVTLSGWLVESLLATRWRHNKHYGKYHYELSDIALAYYHIHMHRIQKSAPVISKNCTSLTKSINEEKEIKINAPIVDNFHEPEQIPKTVDIDLVKQTIILAIVTASPKTRKQTVVKWVNMYGAKGVDDIFKRAKLYSPDNLGAYMQTIIKKTPPVRIDIERITPRVPCVVYSDEERLNAIKRLQAIRKISQMAAGAM